MKKPFNDLKEFNKIALSDDKQFLISEFINFTNDE